ncbi:MAG: efflux RND transporter periplasmic adaptor subunit [Anaerolineae bacterium]|jgi:HlyD family secretion protein|nr:efflux RND transporter periplasmic adaptor subunit [Anaerolineae bacterium]
MKKKWVFIPLLFVLVGAGYAGWQWHQNRTADAIASTAASETTMQTAVVTRGALRGTVEGSGNIASVTSLNLAFDSGGKVAEVLVVAGDTVQAGQPLARLETQDLEDAVKQAQINLTQAELQLAQTREGPDTTDLAAAEASLKSAQVAYNELKPSAAELAQAQLGLEEVKLALESAQASYDRAGGGWRIEVEYSNTATSLWQAQLNYETELASYNTLVAGGTDTERWTAWAKVQQAQANLDALQTSVTTNTLRLAEISVEQAQLDLQKAQRALTQATLEAPIAGTVTSVNIEVGGNASGTAVVLGDLDALEVEITLDENDVVQVSTGQAATITLDAFDDLTLSGVVVTVAPVATVQSGVALYPVKVALDPTGAAVRIGMTADVEIVTVNVEDALLIPLNAVQTFAGRTIVLRQLREGEMMESAMAQGMGGVWQQPSQPETGQNAQQPGNGAKLGRRGSNGTPTAGGGFRQQLSTGGFVPVLVELGAQTSSEVIVLSGLEEGDVISLSTVTTAEEGFEPLFGGGRMLLPGMGGAPGGGAPQP